MFSQDKIAVTLADLIQELYGMIRSKQEAR